MADQPFVHIAVRGNQVLGWGETKAGAALAMTPDIRWGQTGDSLQAYITMPFSKEVQVGCSYSAEHWGSRCKRERDLARCYLVPLFESWGYSFFSGT